MLEIVDGIGLGSGKSFYVMTRCIHHFMRGGTVYASSSFVLYWDAIKKGVKEEHGLILEDRQYNVVDADKITKLHENTPPGTEECPVLIIVDEAHDHFDVRDHADKSKRAFFSWCTQSRHDNNDLIFITQDWKNIDSRFSRLATYRILVRNTKNWGSVALGNLSSLIQLFTLGLNNGWYFVAHRYDKSGKILYDRIWIKPNKRLFGYYESKSCKLAHRRIGSPVEKVNLKKVDGFKKKGSVMFRYIIIAFLIGGIFCIFAFFKKVSNFSALSVDKEIPTSTVASVVQSGKAEAARAVAAAPAVPAWRIEREEFRGVSEYAGGVMLRTDKGQYQRGAMSPKGYVEGVDVAGRVAKLRSPDGGVLYVVGGDPAAVREISELLRRDVSERPVVKSPSKDSIPSWMGQERIALGLGDGSELDFMQARIHGKGDSSQK